MSFGKYLTASQIRGARAILDWSQEELGRLSGLSVATIRKLEAGTISPRGETNKRIRSAFEDSGLEFLDPNGVRQKPDDVSVYQGDDALMRFLDGVYKTAREKHIEILLVCHNEEMFTKALGANDARIHVERMASIKDRFEHKCILTDPQKDRVCEAYCSYRVISRQYVDPVPFYVYDDKYAIIDYEQNPLMPKITVLSSATVSKAFRRQFYSMWEKASPLA